MNLTMIRGSWKTLWVLSMFLMCLPVFAGGAKEAPSGQTATQAETKEIYNESFENGLSGWKGRGSETVAVDQTAARTGKSSLVIKGRKATWNGPLYDMTRVLRIGKSYRISAWVRFDEGPDSQNLAMSLQKTVDGGGQSYETLGQAKMIKGQWVLVEAEYTIPKDRDIIGFAFYFETPYKSADSVKPADLMTFRIDDVTVSLIPPLPPAVAETGLPLLKDIYKDYFPVGVAMMVEQLSPDNASYPLLDQFNMMVTGNTMKQSSIQAKEGEFYFKEADKFVDYCQKNNIKARGHTLVWHQQVGEWMFKDKDDPAKPASKELLYQRMEKHIKTVVGRYKGKIYAWDVVNEAIADGGGNRKSKYLDIAGSTEYIEKAFQWAHEADPDALLFINDYNVEYSEAKRDTLYDLVKSMKAKGVPISGVGMQLHISTYNPTVKAIRECIEKFASLGVKVEITEMDMTIYSSNDEAKKPMDRYIAMDQALRYKALFDLFKEEAKMGNLDAVVIWGTSDKDTWLDNHPKFGRTDHPLPFDKTLKAKPAFWAIADPSRMPIAISRIDSFGASENPDSLDSPAWKLATQRSIQGGDGKTAGTFRLIWTPEGLHVRVAVLDPKADRANFYLDPRNSKTPSLPADAIRQQIARDKGRVEADGSWTAHAFIPVPGLTLRAGMNLGFDLSLQGDGKTASWNDKGNKQETNAYDWGVVNLKVLPRFASAPMGSPKVDGNLDPVWQTAPVLPLDIKSMGSAEENSTLRVLWDENFLYVFYDIKDKLLNDASKNPWEQDSVEVFIDQNNGKTSLYEADDGQYRVNFRNVASFNGGEPGKFKSKTRLTSDGYRVELALPLTLVKGEPGLLLGFDAQFNEADSSGQRVGMRNWYSDSNMGYQDTSVYGLLLLEAAKPLPAEE